MLKPLDTKIIIDPQKTESITPSGLYVPEQATKHTGIGEVVAIGPDVKELVEGDKVFYELPHTITLSAQGRDYHLTKEEFVLARFEKVEMRAYDPTEGLEDTPDADV